MITLQDLQEAIAERQGERDPDSKTCIKLAAFYIIKDHMYPVENNPQPVENLYSYSRGETDEMIDYDSGTEFSDAIAGLSINDVIPVMDELMQVIQAINPRLYEATLDKLRG